MKKSYHKKRIEKSQDHRALVGQEAIIMELNRTIQKQRDRIEELEEQVEFLKEFV